jgi:hypothetical protein
MILAPFDYQQNKNGVDFVASALDGNIPSLNFWCNRSLLSFPAYMPANFVPCPYHYETS